MDLFPAYTKAAVVIFLLALLWSWETWRPFFGRQPERLRHALRNLGLALGNTLLLAATFGVAVAALTGWCAARQVGLLHALPLAWPGKLLAALVLLDGWMYLWHRLAHVVPFLWRFHRMHHSDTHMDVTTATRFHPGEHLISAALRLGLIPLLGLELYQLLAYETLLVAVTQLHHADISLGRWDRPLGWLVVTPDLHKVHHSRVGEETNSNYSSVLSVWDRLARTLRRRQDPAGIVFGLDDLSGPGWQTIGGMLRTPFVDEGPVPPSRQLRRRGPASRVAALVAHCSWFAGFPGCSSTGVGRLPSGE